MLKKIYNTIVQVIFHPAKAWSDIENEGYINNIQSGYVVPLIVIGTISAVLGYWWNNTFEIETSIKLAAISFLSYYVGFWIAAFLIKTFIDKKYNKTTDLQKVLYFTGYSFSVVLATNIIVGLMPLYAFFIKIFNIYTLFIISQGTFILNIEEKQQVGFTVVATAIIILCPLAIESLMYIIMPGMKY
jgi:hypothetical protein